MHSDIRNRLFSISLNRIKAPFGPSRIFEIIEKPLRRCKRKGS